MLGNSRIGFALCALALAGCPRNVGQHSQSGPDQRASGAQEIELDDDGEGDDRDIVTYPGGDRVDWKVVEVPEGKIGELEIELEWDPPRPGLDVALMVYDANYDRVAQAKPDPGTKDRDKDVTVEGAKGGKYFIQVYAPRRIDAGSYRLSVDFDVDDDAMAEAAQGSGEQGGGAGHPIPSPPALPAIPEPGAETGTETATTGGTETGTTETGTESTETTTEVATVEPIRARIVRYQIRGGSALITVDRGKNAGVDRGWKGQILIGSSATPLNGGDFTVMRVTSKEATGKVNVSVDQIKANRAVLLAPPS